MIQEKGFDLPFVHASCDYSSPLMEGESFDLTLQVGRLGTKSITWIVTAAIFRFSSLAALVALAAAPAYAWYFADPQRTEFAALLAIVIWLKHGGNIKRLLTGTETKIGKKS